MKASFRCAVCFFRGGSAAAKNQIGLIAAFSKLLTDHPQLKHHLVLTGKETWFTPKVRDAARDCGFASRIHFTGFVSDADLLNLYNACDCFVFPSFYEGFGLPILEAMACGRAVACSNTSAMPEVADGAGLLFDPHQVEKSPGPCAISCSTPNFAAGWSALDCSARQVSLEKERPRHSRCLQRSGRPNR